ncbi:MAG: hypothetical protein JHC95_11930 [Solirubrobacteraceae bacterium]|nr:hypothetical protein [Solirubrobacteraceae bacterium]
MLPSVAAAVMVLSVVPARAAAPKLGEPRVIASFTGATRVLTSVSDPTHRAIVAVERTPSGADRHVVLFRRANGRYKRFDLPPPQDPIQRVRLALMESGDGLVAWDDKDRVVTQIWHADGRVDRPFVALSSVRPTLVADGTANWALGSDDAGTVVLVAPRAAPRNRMTIQAAVREPGGVFAPAQQVAALPVADVPLFTPTVEPGGAITVRWRGGASARAATGAMFGAPVAATWELSPGFETIGPDTVAVASLSAEIMRTLPRGTARVVLPAEEATNGPVAIGQAIRALCRIGASGCSDLHRFVWPGGVERLAFLASAPAPAQIWQWHVATLNPRRGEFVGPKLVSANPGLVPLRGGTPGRVDFAGVDTDGVPGAQLAGGRLYVMPYGTGEALADRHAPEIGVGDTATSDADAVYIPLWCDEACSLRLRARVERRGRRPGRWQPAAALDRDGSYAVRQEPFQTAAGRVRTRAGDGAVLRLRITATDRAGRRRTETVALRAGRGAAARAWCRIGAAACPA